MTDNDTALVRGFLDLIGEDVDREGLAETPARVVNAWQHWFSGYGREPSDVLKVFKDGAERYDELIIVGPVPVYSHCEHHIAPIIGNAWIGYVPDGAIVGLSKLPRLLDIYQRRLQVQERLTAQVADALMRHLKPLGAGCVIRARHMCMESRGVCIAGTETTTSVMRGVLGSKPHAKAEFFAIVNDGGR